MLYFACGGLTEEHLTQARSDLHQALQNQEKIVDFLIGQPKWIEALSHISGEALAQAKNQRDEDAADLDTAWAAGLKVGKASSPGTWELGYTYQDVEADALLGLVTDSDFAGGGTDANGHILRGAWAVNKQWKIGFTYFDNQRNMDVGDEEDYQRLMLDTAFKF